MTRKDTYQLDPVKVFWIKNVASVAEPIFNKLVFHLKNINPEAQIIKGECETVRFSNNNLQVKVDNVRKHYVVVIHTQTPNVNEDLIELFLLLHAIKRASPADILLVLPYMPMCRSDVKNQPRISVGSQLFAKIINCPLSINKVLLLDPHTEAIMNLFEDEIDSISATPLIVHYLKESLPLYNNRFKLVFPDEGASKRFRKVARMLGIPSAFMVKERLEDDEKPDVWGVVGEVESYDCLIFDDEILTGSTILSNIAILEKAKAKSVRLCAIHPICEHIPRLNEKKRMLSNCCRIHPLWRFTAVTQCQFSTRSRVPPSLR